MIVTGSQVVRDQAHVRWSRRKSWSWSSHQSRENTEMCRIVELSCCSAMERERDKNTNDQSIHFRDDVTRYARCLRSHRFGTHDDTILLRDEIRKTTRRNQERVHIFWEQTSVKWMMWIWHERLHWFLQEWVILSSCGTDYERCEMSARGYWDIVWLQRRTFDGALRRYSTSYQSILRVIKDVWILRTDDLVPDENGLVLWRSSAQRSTKKEIEGSISVTWMKLIRRTSSWVCVRPNFCRSTTDVPTQSDQIFSRDVRGHL